MLTSALLLLLCASPISLKAQTTYANARESSASVAAPKQDESDRLRHALADALSKLEKAQTDLEAAKTLIAEQGKELEAARAALSASKSETDAARRVIEVGDAAMKAQQNALSSVERANAKLEELVERYESRLDKVEAQRDSANRRGFFGSLGSLAVGILLGRR